MSYYGDIEDSIARSNAAYYSLRDNEKLALTKVTSLLDTKRHLSMAKEKVKRLESKLKKLQKSVTLKDKQLAKPWLHLAKHNYGDE